MAGWVEESTRDPGLLPSTSVSFHISLLAVAGQGVTEEGSDRWWLWGSASDMFGFPFYRNERTYVCQIEKPYKYHGLWEQGIQVQHMRWR